MAAIVLRGVTKRYGDVAAVSGLDLAIRDKEFVVLPARPVAASRPR
jgi:ABC-type sugar transport system ATPase subunit